MNEVEMKRQPGKNMNRKCKYRKIFGDTTE